MKIAIMQPTFNPWLGYFDLIDYVDKYIFLDTVQLNQQSWQTRNKIKVKDKELMISIPIQRNKSKSELLIKDTLIDFRKFDFRKKLVRTVEQSYKKSKFFDEVNKFIIDLISYETEYLSNYNINIIKKICNKLNISTEIILMSEANYIADTSKGELVLNICKYFNTNEYVSPIGSKNYLNNSLNAFNSAGIKIEYQYYNISDYRQLGDIFIPYLGIFDLLYNEGFESSKKIIVSGREYKEVK